jgi:hypothetical protein
MSVKLPLDVSNILFVNVRDIEYTDGINDITQLVESVIFGGNDINVIENVYDIAVVEFNEFILNVPILGPLKI